MTPVTADEGRREESRVVAMDFVKYLVEDLDGDVLDSGLRNANEISRSAPLFPSSSHTHSVCV